MPGDRSGITGRSAVPAAAWLRCGERCIELQHIAVADGGVELAARNETASRAAVDGMCGSLAGGNARGTIVARRGARATGDAGGGCGTIWRGPESLAGGPRIGKEDAMNSASPSATEGPLRRGWFDTMLAETRFVEN